MSRKRTMRRDRRRPAVGPSSGEPSLPRRSRTAWGIAIVCLGVAVAVGAWWWSLPGLSDSHAPVASEEPRLSPGEPPLDAASVLGLAPELPQTVAELNDESLAVARLVVASLPDRPEAHAQMAFAQLQVGLDRAALESWQRAVEVDEIFADGYLGRGTLLKELGENEPAIAAFRKAIALDPDLQAAYRELAEVLLRTDQPKEALAVAQECVRLFPADAEHHFWLGQAFLQLEDYAEARRHHEQAIRIDPDYTRSYHSLAIACARLSEHQQAKRYQERFAVLKAAELEADRQQTRAYDDLSKHRQALTKRHVVAGVLQFQVGDPRMAEAHWLRAAAVDANDLATRKALASLYEQQMRPAAAVRFLDELCQLEPDDSEHFLRKGRLAIGMGADAEGQRALQRVLELAPETVEAHLLLAQVLLRAGVDLATAVAHAETAVELAPTPEGLLVLAAVRGAHGDLAGAQSALEQAAVLDPDNPRIRRAYEQLRTLQ